MAEGKEAVKEEAAIVVSDAVGRTEELPMGEDPRVPAVGKWYWVKSEDHEGKPRRWFGCVVHIGSNYVELRGPNTRVSTNVARVHASDFWQECEHVPDPDDVISAKIAHHQEQVKFLMNEVRDVTAKLAIQAGPELSGGGMLAESGQSSETRALALRSGPEQDLGKYKKALVLAQKKTLPDLFKEIKEHNDQLGVWLSASIIPFKAQAEAMEPAIQAIEDRIFSVELYAGLTETVTLIKDGEPAALGEKLQLFQRRAYMDEECLAQYETGGMEFKDIGAFDAWLARPSNFERLLPFPRSVVAFQVRRKEKEREWENLRQFLRMIEDREADKLTFLYLRNGEKLYRLTTEIEFGEKLFPDMEKSKLTGALYAKTWGGTRVEKLISKDEYDAMIAEEEREAAEAAEKRKTAKKKDRWQYEPWRFTFRTSRDYQPFTRESVYYDDISKFIQSEIDKHNRLVLILQGLLDRSTVFHPHPPWQLWDGGGFAQAIALVYDSTRAFTPGDAPDFEAYRDSLNAQIKPGAITVGQDDYWSRVEAARESRRMDHNRRTQSRDWRPTHYRPEGNPGPGKLAHVTGYLPHKKACTYDWARKKARESWDESARESIPCSITVPTSKLLNVSAYKPGDFKKFFNDPRTRADYLQWAPMLLAAEEFCAGNHKVQLPVVTSKKERTAGGAQKYQRQKARKAAGEKAVRLTRKIYLKSGESYDKGTLWRTSRPSRGKFWLYGIDENGHDEINEGGSMGRYARYISGVDLSDFVIDESVTLAAVVATELKEES